MMFMHAHPFYLCLAIIVWRDTQEQTLFQVKLMSMLSVGERIPWGMF